MLTFKNTLLGVTFVCTYSFTSPNESASNYAAQHTAVSSSQDNFQGLNRHNHRTRFNAESFHAISHSEQARPLIEILEERYSVSAKNARRILAAVLSQSRQVNVDPHILLGMIKVESHFDIRAVSSHGAKGLMQVMPNVHFALIKSHGKSTRDLENIEFNIKMGASILGNTLKRSRGDLNGALLRYNGSYGKESDYAEKVYRASAEFYSYTKHLKSLNGNVRSA